ncbi:WapI family immunity protein [Planococcus lenghuensis]|uniref:Uncharacterized protein n=1 Tax=Planococcus lenghuensis TaxID=2213202 RepID=A0A1Q2KYK0_9BACL|nr:hypothetical protein [Planococcus lenghuensis]AQQ53288.1 hypothetical protein B0X71_09480 [Planococcus lenghuensis]
MKIHLLGKEAAIQIEVVSRIYPNSLDYWDGNWIVTRISIEIPGYSVQFSANLRTDELRDFVKKLKVMNKKLKGKASLENIDGFIDIKCEINLLGKIYWEVETCYPAGTGAVLHFNFESDQMYLENLIKELDEVIIAFPILGED